VFCSGEQTSFLHAQILTAATTLDFYLRRPCHVYDEASACLHLLGKTPNKSYARVIKSGVKSTALQCHSWAAITAAAVIAISEITNLIAQPRAVGVLSVYFYFHTYWKRCISFKPLVVTAVIGILVFSAQELLWSFGPSKRSIIIWHRGVDVLLRGYMIMWTNLTIFYSTWLQPTATI